MLLLGLVCLCHVGLLHSCQPPLPYHSNAVYGSQTYQVSDNAEPLVEQPSSFVQESQDFVASNDVQGELDQGQAGQVDGFATAGVAGPVGARSEGVPGHARLVNLSDASAEGGEQLELALPRPENPFPEGLDWRAWSALCMAKTLAGFMDVLDCTEVEASTNDAETARLGDAACTVDRGQLCRFYDDRDAELQFRTGRFVHQRNGTRFGRFEEQLAVLSRRPLGAVPSDAFLVLAEPFGHTPDAEAVLRMDVPCQRGDGVLVLEYWSTVFDVELKVCTRVDQERRCTANIDYNPDSTQVEVQVINPETSPFVVEIVVSGFKKPGLFLIDNINYEAVECGSDNQESAVDVPLESATPSDGRSAQVPAQLIDPHSGVKSKLNIKQVHPNVCNAVECNFEADLCSYTQPELSGNINYGKWQLGKFKVGNINSDDLNDNRTPSSPHTGFAFVGVDNRGPEAKGRTVYILESDDLELPSDAVLFFDLYRKSNAISLQVCLNTLTNCPYEAPALKSPTYWKENESVALPMGTTKVYFVATQWKRSKWLAIDEIRLDLSCGH